MQSMVGRILMRGFIGWTDLSPGRQKRPIPPWSIVNDIKSPTFNMFLSLQPNLTVLRFKVWRKDLCIVRRLKSSFIIYVMRPNVCNDGTQSECIRKSLLLQQFHCTGKNYVMTHHYFDARLRIFLYLSQNDILLCVLSRLKNWFCLFYRSCAQRNKWWDPIQSIWVYFVCCKNQTVQSPDDVEV